MRSHHVRGQTGCWMDTFTGVDLEGEIRRHFGPKTVKRFDPASVIIGPDARVEITGRVGGQEIILVLRSSSIHTHLKSLIPGFRFSSADIFEHRKPARPIRRPVRELQLV